MSDAQLVKPGDPLDKIVAFCDDKLEMVESGAALAELIARIPLVTDVAKYESARRLDHADVAHTAIS